MKNESKRLKLLKQSVTKIVHCMEDYYDETQNNTNKAIESIKTNFSYLTNSEIEQIKNLLAKQIICETNNKQIDRYYDELNLNVKHSYSDRLRKVDDLSYEETKTMFNEPLQQIPTTISLVYTLHLKIRFSFHNRCSLKSPRRGNQH